MSVVRTQEATAMLTILLLYTSVLEINQTRRRWSKLDPDEKSNYFLCVLKPCLNLYHCFEAFIDFQLDDWALFHLPLKWWGAEDNTFDYLLSGTPSAQQPFGVSLGARSILLQPLSSFLLPSSLLQPHKPFIIPCGAAQLDSSHQGCGYTRSLCTCQWWAGPSGTGQAFDSFPPAGNVRRGLCGNTVWPQPMSEPSIYWRGVPKVLTSLSLPFIPSPASLIPFKWGAGTFLILHDTC